LMYGRDSGGLTLPLLVPGIGANDPDHVLAFDDLAVLTQPLD
jgi:hypothetical protein